MCIAIRPSTLHTLIPKFILTHHLFWETGFFLKMNSEWLTLLGFSLCFNFYLFFSGCGGYLHTSRGVITSPNYPQNYSPNLNCSWHVVVATGSIIAVHFEEPFQIKSEDTSCTLGDYIEVRLLAGSPNPQSY